MLLRVLEVLKPWRPTGGIDTRDTWRVHAISTFPLDSPALARKGSVPC
jgi:hypothetical protein